MKLVAIVILVLLSFNGLSQSFTDVELTTSKYPRRFKSPERLAARVKMDFQDDLARAKAIYTWMGHNIRYDVKKYLAMKQPGYARRHKGKRISVDAIAAQTLRKRKGVCADYSALYQAVCKLSGIECAIIEGFGKTRTAHIGKFPLGQNHAWNAVNIGGEWNLLDVTWAAGHVDETMCKFHFDFDTTYFFSRPDLFSLNHFPRNKEWLLNERTDSAFALLPLYHTLDTQSEFVLPNTGILSVRKGTEISFHIKSTRPVAFIHYAYIKEKKVKQIFFEENDGTLDFLVPSPVSKIDHITIYLDLEPIATFRVRTQAFIRSPFTGLKVTYP